MLEQRKAEDGIRSRPSRGTIAVAVVGFFVANLAFGLTVRYVGTGPSCNQPNHHPTLAAALFAAAFTLDADEIRLTNTLTYPRVSTLNLTDWDPATAGALTLAGGYQDCSSTSEDDAAAELVGALFLFDTVRVQTSSRPTSDVTFRTIKIREGARGLRVSDGGTVSLENATITNNIGGVEVEPGGSLSADRLTNITANDGSANLFQTGGGVSCSGNSYVGIAGDVSHNSASLKGGNIYVGDDCIVELFGGATVTGGDSVVFPEAGSGGGIYVEDGHLVATGGADLVFISRNFAANHGGGLFITGPDATATLTNTEFLGNRSRVSGGAIQVENGALLTMDRGAGCPRVVACSHLRESSLIGGILGEVLFIDNARAHLRNTVIDRNGVNQEAVSDRSLIRVDNGGLLEVDGLDIVLNNANYLFHANTGSEIRAAYVTSGVNGYTSGGLPADPWNAFTDGATSSFYSSIFVDGKGFQDPNGGVTNGNCLLVDTGNGLPPGSFFISVPVFTNYAVGDLRQEPTSPGVDMCPEQVLPWVGTLDIGLDPRGVDVLGNSNGFPGVLGGTYDAGFHEVVGDASPIFSDGFESGDTTAWSGGS